MRGSLAFLLPFLILSLVGCQQSSPRLETLACPDLAFERGSAQPLDSVIVSGLPTAFRHKAAAEVRVPGDTLVGHTWLAEDSTTGTWTFLVPLYPGGQLEGGDVTLRIVGTTGACPTADFTIDALPEAPGTTTAVADGLQRSVAARAATYGLSPTDLRRVDPLRAAPPLVALAVAQAALDHPDNPNSLRRILAGEAPRLGKQTPPLTVLDALWAKAGLADRIHTLAAAVEREPRVSDELLERFRRSAGTGDGASVLGSKERADRWSPFRTVSFTSPPPQTAAPSPNRGLSVCPGDPSFYEPDAATLSLYMKASLKGTVATTGYAKDVFNVLQATLAVGAAIPIPVYQQTMAAAGAASIAHIFSHEMDAGVLPRTFKSMTVMLDKPFFQEDDADPGRWSDLRVTTTSTGWEGTKKVLEELINQGFGRVSGVAALGSARGETYRGVAEAAMNYGVADAQTAAGISDAALGDRQINWGPCEFGPTDVSAETWSEVRVTGSPAIALAEGDRRTYVPQQSGTSTLLFSTRTGDIGGGQLGLFGLEKIQLEETVEVRAVEIRMIPPRIRVTPGESVTIRAEVQNADDQNLEWTITPSGHQVITAGVSNHVADVTTSPNADDFSATLTARSTADRSHLLVAPERSASTIIQGSELVVTPANACLRPGETEQFFVETPDVETGGIVLSGGPDDSGGADFDWSASAGSINRRGLFDAPTSGDGTATITAQDRDDPTVRGEVTIRYGEQCRSQFTYTASGAPQLTERGTIDRFRGDKFTDGCFVQIALEGDPSGLWLKALLPDGLRSGTFTVGRNYLGELVPGDKANAAWQIHEIPSASPEVFFAALDVGWHVDQDGRRDKFLTQGGTVNVEQDGDVVSMRFEMDLIEDDNEGLDCNPRAAQLGGRPCLIPPRRRAHVTGSLTHTLTTERRKNYGSWDVYLCDPLP